jgi:hypothetical protein
VLQATASGYLDLGIHVVVIRSRDDTAGTFEDSIVMPGIEMISSS